MKYVILLSRFLIIPTAAAFILHYIGDLPLDFIIPFTGGYIGGQVVWIREIKKSIYG